MFDYLSYLIEEGVNIDYGPHFPHDWRRAAEERDGEQTNGNRGTTSLLPSSLSLSSPSHIIIIILVIVIQLINAEERDVEKTNDNRGTSPLISSLSLSSPESLSSLPHIILILVIVFQSN